MNRQRKKSEITVIALISGGLDSTLAAALIRRLGFNVYGVNFNIGFYTKDRSEVVRQAGEYADIPVRYIDVATEYLPVIKYPKHGYGSAVNPCLDCRIFSLRKAKRLMGEMEAEFVITGEVLKQRPMSQHYRALALVAEQSGLGNRLLRPLSANLLPLTLPVEEGWISREDLYDIQGRTRSRQIELAAALGITKFPQPSGGCCALLEKSYAQRVRDAFTHNEVAAMTTADFALLRWGRHFRLSPHVKVIIGRHEEENELLQSRFGEGRIIIEPLVVMGPTTLVEGNPEEEELQTAAKLSARYCDGDGSPLKMIVIRDKVTISIEVEPFAPDDPRIEMWRI